MKNKLSFLLSVVCLWGVILVSGCSEKDETPTNLTLKEGTQTTQVVYADEVTNQGGISFTALSDWTATVTEVATEASTKAASGKVEWLELSAYSGGPGEYTLTLTLIENLTGKDRKATIEIRCGNDVITITVEQKQEKLLPRKKSVWFVMRLQIQAVCIRTAILSLLGNSLIMRTESWQP